MKTHLLAAVAILALSGGAHAQSAESGKSRLEVAKDLAEDCRTEIEWGIIPKQHIEDCVTARLRTLDNAIRRFGPRSPDRVTK
jgi:hypothetical protein